MFLARHRGAAGFSRLLVIKRLFPNMAAHPPLLAMFQLEGRLMAHLRHPNIPQVYELGEAKGQWYLAMEWVDGLTLADAWPAGRRPALPLAPALSIVHQVAEALHHAHGRFDEAGQPLGIVHRDVTPGNVMVTRDGVAKLMDFGIARTTLRPDTVAGTTKGTLAYMAPEQVRSGPIDGRADVFALGVILYELTTGVRLFSGTDVAVMAAVVERDVPPPSVQVTDYSADLEAVVLRALRRDRGQRYQDAKAFAQAVAECALRAGLVLGPTAVAHHLDSALVSRPSEDTAPEIRSPAEGCVGDPLADDTER